MSQQSILDFISTQGLGWFLAIVLLVPVAMLGVLLALLAIAKRYMGLDFKALQQNQRDEVEAEIELGVQIKTLSQYLKDMEEALWSNREYTDRRVKELQENYGSQHKAIEVKVDKVLDNQHRIIVFLVRKLGKTRTVSKEDSATEVFLQERKP